MKVIIPAAGAGSRLRPYTYTVPKTLLPIAGKPILGYILDQVICWGASKVSIIHGYLGNQIKSYVKDNYDISVDFRLQEKQYGLGHAVYLGIDEADEDILVILGDTILETDVTSVISKKVTAVGVKEVSNPLKFGVVVVQDGKVIKLVEKPRIPPSNLALVGIYYIRNANILKRAIKKTMDDGIMVKGEYQMTDALQLLLEWGEEVQTLPIKGWFDCGKPETLLETNNYILQRDGGKVEDSKSVNSVVLPPVYIGEGTTIKNSIIGPNVSIGKNCDIEEAIITDSMIGDKTKIETAILSRTLVGYRAEVIGTRMQINLGSSSWLKL